jgi:uncharacterized protein (DUF1015 family)
MVELRPIRGWHPDPLRVDSDQLVCPVYDTLSESELARFSKHPHNAARFVPRPHGMTTEQFVRRASDRLQEALSAGAYVQDARPAFYVYGIRYVPPPDIFEIIEPEHQRHEYLLLGLVGTLPFESNGHAQVAMHERTFEDRVEERIALTEATGMNFAPIMAGYHLPDHRLNDHLERYLGLHRRSLAFESRVAPVAEAVLEGTRHRLWRIDEPAEVEQIAKMVRELRLLILDGHHRYTAAARRFHAGHPAVPLTMLVEGQDRALRVLPWHRVLPWNCVPFDSVSVSLRREFPEGTSLVPRPTVEAALERLRSFHRLGHRGFLAVGPDGMVEVHGPPSHDVGADFDLLHTFLEDRLGIDPHDLEFVRSPRHALARATERPGTAFLLSGMTEKGIEERAFGSGRVMAHKSTMFLPKVVEGMLFAPADRAGSGG